MQTNPANPQTVNQELSRSYFSQLTKQWGGALSASERAGWDAWAALNPATDRLGQVAPRSGLTAYLQLNWQRLAAGVTPIQTSPTLPQPGQVGFVDDPENDAISLIFNFDAGTGQPPTSWFRVGITAPLSSPAITPRPSLYRLAGGLAGFSYILTNAGVTSVALGNLVTPAPVGARVGIEVVIVNEEGWAGQPRRSTQTVIPG